MWPNLLLMIHENNLIFNETTIQVLHKESTESRTKEAKNSEQEEKMV